MATRTHEDALRLANAEDDVRCYSPLVAKGTATVAQLACLKAAWETIASCSNTASSKTQRPGLIQPMTNRCIDAWEVCGSERTEMQNMRDIAIIMLGSVMFFAGLLLIIVGAVELSQLIL